MGPLPDFSAALVTLFVLACVGTVSTIVGLAWIIAWLFNHVRFV